MSKDKHFPAGKAADALEEKYKWIVIVTIDKRGQREKNEFPTNGAYYSDLFETDEEVKAFLEQVDKDFPNNTLKYWKAEKDYVIQYMRFRIDESNPAEFEAIRHTARAYKNYSEAVRELKGE